MRTLFFLVLFNGNLVFAARPCDFILAEYGAAVTLRSDEEASAFEQAGQLLYGQPLLDSDFHEGRLSLDGTRALILTSKGFRVWDIKNKRYLHPLVQATFPRPPKLTDDGLRVVGAADKTGISVWDAASGKLLSQFKPRIKGTVEKISLDGRFALVVGSKPTPVPTEGPIQTDEELLSRLSRRRELLEWELTVFDTATGRAVRRLRYHQSPFREGYFSKSGKWVVTTSDDGLVRCENMGTGEVTLSFGTGAKPDALEFSPDERSLLVTPRGKRALILSTDRSHAPAELSAAWGVVYDGAFSPASNDTLVLHTDSGFHVIDRKTNLAKISISGTEDTYGQFRFSSDGKYFLFFFLDKDSVTRLFVGDVATARPLYELKTGASEEVPRIAYSEAGGVVGVSLPSDALKLWSVGKIPTIVSPDAKTLSSADGKYYFDRVLKADGLVELKIKLR